MSQNISLVQQHAESIYDATTSPGGQYELGPVNDAGNAEVCNPTSAAGEMTTSGTYAVVVGATSAGDGTKAQSSVFVSFLP